MTVASPEVPKSRSPRVAVVVPCRNEAAHISGLLDALAGQTRTPDEIIVVNDASTDATVDVVRAWHSAHPFGSAQGRPAQTVLIVEGTGNGPAAAVNAGVRATDADVIMRMDGHSVPAGDYLERCLDIFSEQPGFSPAVTDGLKPVGSEETPVGYEERTAGVVGGVWRVEAGADTAVARAIAAVVSRPIGSGGAAYRSPDVSGPERVSVETVPFGTFPRAVWERLGGFDESLAVNEDFDFNYRARLAGYDVVLDRRISATYFARPTLGALWRQYLRYGFWKTQMLRKDPRAFHLRQLPPALVVPWLLLSVVAAFLVGGPIGTGIASLYPLIVILGGLHVGLTRSVSPVAAAAAIATVHVAWSVGFWRGALNPGASRQRARSRT